MITVVISCSLILGRYTLNLHQAYKGNFLTNAVITQPDFCQHQWKYAFGFHLYLKILCFFISF